MGQRIFKTQSHGNPRVVAEKHEGYVEPVFGRLESAEQEDIGVLWASFEKV